MVPFADSQELLRNSNLPSESLIPAGTEHRLADEESLKKMVDSIESVGFVARAEQMRDRMLLLDKDGKTKYDWKRVKAKQ
jgi:hypothetical protein